MDLILSSLTTTMAGVDRHMKQRRNIVMNLSLWRYSRKLMMSRVSCSPKSVRTSMTIVFASDMRDVTLFMDPENRHTDPILIPLDGWVCGWEPPIVFGCSTRRSGLVSDGSMAANACAS